MDLWAVDYLNVNSGQVALTSLGSSKPSDCWILKLERRLGWENLREVPLFSKEMCDCLTSKHQSYEYLKCAWFETGTSLPWATGCSWEWNVSVAQNLCHHLLYIQEVSDNGVTLSEWKEELLTLDIFQFVLLKECEGACCWDSFSMKRNKILVLMSQSVCSLCKMFYCFFANCSYPCFPASR